MIQIQINLSLKWVQSVLIDLLARIDLDELSYELRHKANT